MFCRPDGREKVYRLPTTTVGTVEPPAAKVGETLELIRAGSL